MKCQVDAIQWGGGSSRNFPFSVVSKRRRDSVGGGVVAEFFRFPWSPKGDAVQWGGGGVAEFFSGSPNAHDSVGGGG